MTNKLKKNFERIWNVRKTNPCYPLKKKKVCLRMRTKAFYDFISKGYKFIGPLLLRTLYTDRVFSLMVINDKLQLYKPNLGHLSPRWSSYLSLTACTLSNICYKLINVKHIVYRWTWEHCEKFVFNLYM